MPYVYSKYRRVLPLVEHVNDVVDGVEDAEVVLAEGRLRLVANYLTQAQVKVDQHVELQVDELQLARRIGQVGVSLLDRFDHQDERLGTIRRLHHVHVGVVARPDLGGLLAEQARLAVGGAERRFVAAADAALVGRRGLIEAGEDQVDLLLAYLPLQAQPVREQRRILAYDVQAAVECGLTAQLERLDVGLELRVERYELVDGVRKLHLVLYETRQVHGQLVVDQVKQRV